MFGFSKHLLSGATDVCVLDQETCIPLSKEPLELAYDYQISHDYNKSTCIPLRYMVSRFSCISNRTVAWLSNVVRFNGLFGILRVRDWWYFTLPQRKHDNHLHAAVFPGIHHIVKSLEAAFDQTSR